MTKIKIFDILSEENNRLKLYKKSNSNLITSHEHAKHCFIIFFTFMVMIIAIHIILTVTFDIC